MPAMFSVLLKKQTLPRYQKLKLIADIEVVVLGSSTLLNGIPKQPQDLQ